MGLCKSGGGKNAANKKSLRPIGYEKPKVDMRKVTWEQMQATPQEEEDLIPVPVYINMDGGVIVDEEIRSTDIKSQALREIFIGDEESAIQSINALQRENKWVGGFQFDLLMAFWLSVHYGRIKVLNHLIQYDIYLRQLVTLALKGQPEKPRVYKKTSVIAKLKPFDRTAGLTPDTLHLAGIGRGTDSGRDSKRDSKRALQQNSGNKATPPVVKEGDNLKDSNTLPPINQKAVVPFSEEMPDVDASKPGQNFIEQNMGGGNLGNRGGEQAGDTPVARTLFEGGQQFEGGSDEGPDEFKDNQGGPGSQHDVSHDDYSDGGEDGGEGDSDGSANSKSCGSRKSIGDFEQAQMGGLTSEAQMRKVDDCSITMGSQDMMLVNQGDPDDTNFAGQGPVNHEKAPRITMKDDESQNYLIERGITGLDIEMMSLETREDSETLKTKCRIYFPRLMADITKILLHKKEEKLACLLTAYYELSIEDEDYAHAISSKNWAWLKYVWAFGKNYVRSRRDGEATLVTVKMLLKKVSDAYENNEKVRKDSCKEVCEWMMVGDSEEHNVLGALLEQNMEELALDYMGWYMRFLDKGLFIFALSNNNTHFMKEALKKQAFDKQMYTNAKVVSTMLAFFKDDASKTNFILNVLLLTDIALWKQRFLEELIELFELYTEGEQLLLSYNPLMSIALTCDLLVKIGNSRKMFRDQCVEMTEGLLALGEIYSSKVDDEAHYKALINDKDFNGRSVLNIICYSQFQPLMSEEDPKASNLIRDIWQGEDFTKCDGNIFGYSNISHILQTRAKRADANAGFFTIVSGDFKPTFKVDYSFQFKYRSDAISQYFLKEIMLALLIVWMFQSVNDDYRMLFVGPLAYVGMVEDAATGISTLGVTESHGMYDFTNYEPEVQVEDPVVREAMMRDNLAEFGTWYPTILFLCGSLCYSVSLKVLFNALAPPGKDFKVPIDRWTKLDLISAVATLVGFPFILQTEPVGMMTKGTKDGLDYIVLVLILLQWTRFYMFFLMISELSKMILTFIAMVIDTIAFMFIVIAYLIVAAAIFTTMFQDINPIYVDFKTSLRTLFDGLMAGYSYKGFGDKETLHMLMLILHICLSNILMLNYLIAILSDSYSHMLDKGKFLYKVYLYQYCERYMVGLANKEYGQLVLHPAPICALNFPLVLFVCIPGLPGKYKETVGSYFALLMFWLENVVWLLLFMAYEIAQLPLVYLKNLFVVAWATQGLFLTIWHTAAWLFSGPVLLVFFALRDIYYMFKILRMHQGCREAGGIFDELEVKKIDVNEEVMRYNEARDVAIQKYLDVRNAGADDGDDGDAENALENFNIIEAIADDEDIIAAHKDDFVVKASTLVSEWQKVQATRQKADDEPAKKEEEKSKAQEEDAAAKEARERQEDAKKADAGSREAKTTREFNSRGDKSVTGTIVQQFVTTVVNNEQNDDRDEEELEKEDEKGGGDDESAGESAPFEPELADIDIVKRFYDMFLINAEGSATNDNVDVILLLRAMPTKVLPLTLPMIQKFRFLILQDAIDASNNSDRVTSFEFYDRKNKGRVNNVKALVQGQMANLQKIEKALESVKEQLGSKEALLNEYDALARQWAQEKEKIAADEIQEKKEECEEQDAQLVSKVDRGGKGKKGKKGGKK